MLDDRCDLLLEGEGAHDPRLLWLMGEDVDMPFADWVEAVQQSGEAEGSHIFYTDRIAPLYTLSPEKKAAMLDAIIEEMLVHRHRALSPDLEAVIVPMALQMRKDRLKYQRKCEKNHLRRQRREHEV